MIFRRVNLSMKKFLPHFESCLSQMIWRLSTLVEGETPTHEKTEVDRLIYWLANWGNDQDAQVQTYHQPIVGDFVECRWNPDAPGKPILMPCHVDTVHPLGSVEKRPTCIEEDVLFGVGAYDMKPGIITVQTVMERDALMQKTFQTLIEISGQHFGESSRGGGSDGSFSAAMGIPTLDGLGPSGEGAHAAHKQVYLPSMPRRAALLASILTNWP